ncbi:hypothetical protein TNCV_4001471 [Trichonephila clavipes]|uniref:Uncharacterized protein n=1 Tax=Trichonephila clavipes TaxID=2585209 RepID=A0A8X6RP23_TRICX|nr:hypothetical protein TNCV_4001471 [Trichonephila clavipes]
MTPERETASQTLYERKVLSQVSHSKIVCEYYLFEKDRVIPPTRKRNCKQHVLEFDSGRMGAYPDYGLLLDDIITHLG